jgi:hypothetical protein
MPISNYQNGFPNGVTIRNVPILDMQNGQSNAFWVDSNSGSNENKGTFNSPFATLLYALTRVQGGQADKIYLAAGHTETITDASTYVISTRGVQIIGLGLEEMRPIIRFGTSVNAKLSITADDSYIGNVMFLNTQPSLVNMLDITGYGVTLESCLFSGDTYLVTDYVKIGESNTKFIDCEVYSPGSGAQSAFLFDYGTIDNQFIGCNVRGGFSEGCINIPSTIGGSGVKNLFVEGGEYENTSTLDSSVFLKSTEPDCTGMVADNVNIRVNNEQKFPFYLVSGCKIGRGKAGDIISFTAIIPVAKVGATGGNFLVEIASGSFYLEDAIIETDNNALGGATNILMQEENDTYGLATFYTETVANLSLNKSISLDSASLVGQKRGFAQNSRIRVSRSGATLTGTNLRVSFVLKLLEDGSTIVKNLSF